MFFQKMILALAIPALVTVAACTERTDKQADASQDDASGAVAAGGLEDVALPAMAPLYPGATVKSHIVARSSEEDGGGAAVVLSTSDSVDKVIGFYDANAKKQKATTNMTIGTGDGAMRVYADKDDNTAMVSISRGDEATEIVITTRNNPPAS